MNAVCPRYVVQFQLLDRSETLQSSYFDTIKDKILSETPPSEMNSEDIISESEMLLTKFEQFPTNYFDFNEGKQLIEEKAALLQNAISEMVSQYRELIDSFQSMNNENQKKLSLLQLIMNEKLKLFLSIEIELSRLSELIQHNQSVVAAEYERYLTYLQQCNGHNHSLIIYFFREFLRKYWSPYQSYSEVILSQIFLEQTSFTKNISQVSNDLKVTSDVKPLIKPQKKTASSSKSKKDLVNANFPNSLEETSTPIRDDQLQSESQEQSQQQQQQPYNQEKDIILDSIHQYHAEKLLEVKDIIQQKAAQFQQLLHERNGLREWKFYKNHINFQDKNFEVLLSCEDNHQQKWVLLKRSEFQGEGVIEEWMLENVLLLSYENELQRRKSGALSKEKSTDKENSKKKKRSLSKSSSKDEGNQFSIGKSLFLFIFICFWVILFSCLEGDDDEAEEENERLHQDAVDLHVPDTIQHSLHQQFDQEKTVLVKEKEELSKEIENSRTAFERYRERARESLLKTASDQKANEQKIEKLKEQLKVSETFLSQQTDIYFLLSE
jgi:hypothetical protein